MRSGLGVLAVLALGLATMAATAPLQAGLLAAGIVLAAGLAAALLRDIWQMWRQTRAFAALEAFVEHDAAACLLVDLEGVILWANATARGDFKVGSGQMLSRVLSAVVADASGLAHRVQKAALAEGIAREDVVLRGRHLRVCAHQVGPSALLWRLDGHAGADRESDAGALPTMTLGREGAVLWMNAAALDLAGKRIRRVDELIDDMPLRPGEPHRIRSAGVARTCIVSLRRAGAGREELTLLPAPERAASDVGFDHLPVPLLRVSSGGEILGANRRARQLLAAENVDGCQLTEYMEGLGRSIRDWLADAAAGKGLRRSEFLRLTRPDREVIVQVTLTQVVENGETTLIAVLNDATELKTLEAQFVQSQKMQAIGQLAGGVAHDFNNLLTAISGHCDLLLLRHDQGDPDYGDLIQIHQNANRAAALVGQLLAFSRKQTLRPEALDLRDTLSDLTHLLNRLVGEKVTLELRHNPVLPMIRADKRQLEQVIMNLVVNARDAMPGGGTVIIETGELVLTEPRQYGRASVPPGRYVTVKVQDDGAGISRDKLEKIFEPFYTTKRTGEGTGLGLSTVYGIVKQTGGYIFVDSAPGEGSCFSLLFPASEAIEEDAAPVVEEARRPASGHGDGVVLLVEDEAPVRAFASRALRLRGYTVIEAPSAEAALELLEDRSLKVDVFVTDVVMPGMDGPSWVRQARDARPDVPVVFMSGYAEDVFKSQDGRLPDSAFLSKPFSLNELTEIVQRQIQ